MTFLSRLTDRLVLQPTTHFVDPEGQEQRIVATPGGRVEVWINRTGSESADPMRVVILKFPGTGGRAERGGPHPAELWDDIAAEVWTINHAGYGGSQGTASLENFAETCEAVWEEANQDFSDHKIVVYGNSLGCLSALYLSARYPAAAVCLRNPVPLAQMISKRTRYTWWNFGLSRLIANEVPKSLDAIENAQRTTCPAFIVQSELDRVIPPSFQEMVISKFGGEHRKFVINGADHHHRVSESQHGDYIDAVQWIQQQIRE